LAHRSGEASLSNAFENGNYVQSDGRNRNGEPIRRRSKYLSHKRHSGLHSSSENDDSEILTELGGVALDRFARVVLGYHGCDPDFANSLLSGETKIRDWEPSRNKYDWLGHGIYFWEHGPERARTWGRNKKKGVIGAVIQLGLCLDLTDVRFTDLLKLQYESLLDMAKILPLPENGEGGRNDLDCLVINELVKNSEQIETRFQTVRCPFLEGEPAFPGAKILKESHIQIAVIDKDCILGVFRPNLDL
jgi:hypothetical protein